MTVKSVKIADDNNTDHCRSSEVLHDNSEWNDRKQIRQKIKTDE